MLSKIYHALVPQRRRAQIRRLIYELQHKDVVSLIKGNTKFKDIHKGKRCFILGNGPSIAKLDFSLLGDEFVFTMNQIPRMKDFCKLRSNYHVWTDSILFHPDENNPSDMEIIDVMRKVNTANYTGGGGYINQ